MNFWHVLLIGVGLYIVADAFFDVSEKISRWVRGAWGSVSGAVMGSPPARAATLTEVEAPITDREKIEILPSGKKAKVDWGRAAGNILAFFTGLVAWIVKHPIAAAGIAVLILWLVVGASCSVPFGKSKGELRLERELAQAETRMQQRLNERNQDIAELRAEARSLREQIRTNGQRGRDAIAAATPEHEEPLDPGLVAAWRDGLDGLCVPRADGDRLDTCRP